MRVALVGCGAIAQIHARALLGAGLSLDALFDVDRARAGELRRAMASDAVVCGDLDEVARHAEAAIVAVPNAHHADTTIALLSRGLHVLCEKPLALTVADGERMIAAAAEHGRLLACGLVRRFFVSSELCAEALARGLIGEVRRIEVRESVYNWPMSRSTFDRALSGGGAFIDIAPHVLDLLAQWLGPLTLVEYRDDARGGVEATAAAQLRAGTVECRVHLTRAWGTANRWRLEGTRGAIEIVPHVRDAITLWLGDFPTVARRAGADPFVAQLRNFAAAVEGREPLRAPAAAALPNIALIEEAHRARAPLVDDTLRVEPLDTPFRKILVTGATGAVGSRMIEMEAAAGALDRYRCLVRSFKSAARLMRFPVEIATADLEDRAAVEKAARGCDAIVHLGVGERAEAETRPIVEAARALGIRRFIHMSSAAVYGARIPASVEKDQDRTPLRTTGESYADEKAAAERVVLAARDLDAVLLRPHIVYGPGMRWTGDLIELLRRGEVCIVDGGGSCNLIYVDDLVESVRAALKATRGFHEPMFVTDGRPIPWRDYILAHARIIDAQPPVRPRAAVERGHRTVGEWLRASLRPVGPLLRSREFRALVFDSPAIQSTVFRAYLAARNSPRVRPFIDRFRNGAPGPVATRAKFHEGWTTLQLSDARLSPARATELIGFRARVGFDEGLRRALAWFSHVGVP